jgi:hypothetical protein
LHQLIHHFLPFFTKPRAFRLLLRTTSLDTSARYRSGIGWAATVTVSFIRTIATLGRNRSRDHSFISECGRNFADTDDADQVVIVDDRQMADKVLVH